MSQGSEVVHYIDDAHWSGWCPATTGLGTLDPHEVTCGDCIALVTA